MKGVGFATGVIVLLLTFCSIALDDVWFFDVLASLRLQIVVGSAVLAGVALIFRKWYAAGLLTGAVLVNAALMAPPFQHPGPAPGARSDLSMVFFNSAQNTLQLFPLLEFVKERQPDLLVFTEVFRWDIDNLRQTFSGYPHSVGEPGVFGAVVLSRAPIADFRVHRHAAGPSGRTLEVRLCGNGGNRCAALLVLHPTPPLNGDFRDWRNDHIANATAYAKIVASEGMIDGRVIMAGDFNLTPWNRLYMAALEASGFADAFQSRLPHSTWFSSFAVIGLPIDHIWTGPGVGVVDTAIGPPSGSDHLPIHAAFELGFEPGSGG
ncbi:MAG: endonuclease/exonuclease/phosphatase family protein [Minwuia sp.]|uniref:endonuclease/exonuclease/phosphatase family protein n=1 Tax=Minwuia sp. TaxID=2493630 RepID=UPI003A883139